MSIVYLIPIGIESKTGEQFGPIYKDFSFRYIPIPDIPEYYCKEQEELLRDKNPEESALYRRLLTDFGSYRNVQEILPSNQTGSKFLADYLTEKQYSAGNYQAKLPDWIPHLDPEFSTYTYGEGSDNKAKSLSKLKNNDLLVFYATLRSVTNENSIRKYIIGYFTIKEIFDYRFSGIKLDFQDIPEMICKNAHIIRGDSDPVIALGKKEKSKLLEKAIPLTNKKWEVNPEIIDFLPWDFNTKRIHMGTRIFESKQQYDNWKILLNGDGPSKIYKNVSF